MRLFKKLTAATLVFALTFLGIGFGLTTETQAQTRRRTQTRTVRANDRQVEQIIRGIERRSDVFRTSLDRALDRSQLDNTNREENINEFIKDFENSTDELRRKFDGRTSVAADVSNLLVRAARIDDFVKRNLRRETIVQRDWTSLRTDLNQLANYYSLAFNLDNRRSMPAFSTGSVLTNADAGFTGTYRLNAFQSGNARTVAENATRSISRNNRTAIFNRLVSRLEAPEILAVGRQGNRVMLASTRAPQITLDVDNIEHIESYPNGRASRVRASFSGDTLTIVSNGDRLNDFTAMFAPLDGGRRMLVTRRVYAEQLNQPVEVKSYYDRTSDVAQFNIYNNTNASINAGTNTSAAYNFIVPANTVLIAALNTNLSTKTARDGDRFTMTVRSPSQYAGAIIAGYVSNADRSGRVSGRSEITLNYETIRLRNNQTYRFAGLTESVSNISGERVQVDNEGAVEDRSSRTNQTIGRTTIGAGTGAGSVYIQGRDDLTLTRGAEFTIRASAPRS